MSGDQIKGLRDLQRANMGDITDIASQLLARQLIALGARGEPPPPLPPPPPPKKERVRRCSPTSKATLQPWKADCVPAHMLPAARKKLLKLSPRRRHRLSRRHQGGRVDREGRRNCGTIGRAVSSTADKPG
ncbi:hypothetical protein ACVWXN_000446 [Bradyrhizobium sp. i1.4.4]